MPKLSSNSNNENYKVYSYILKTNKTQSIILYGLTLMASKLWNVGNYERRNWTKDSNTPYPDWYDQKKRLKTNYFYKQLASQTAQEVLKQLDEAWKSYYELIKTNKDKNPKPPRFKRKPFSIRFLNNGFKIVGNKLRLSLSSDSKKYLEDTYNITLRYLYIKLPKKVENIKIVEIKPLNYDTYKVSLIYEVPKTKSKEDNNIYMSVDLGINNLATLYISTGQSYIISGRQLLSINRYFDKKIAYYQGIDYSYQASKQKGDIKYYRTTKRIKKLYEKHSKQVNHIIHSATKTIVDIAKKHNVSNIIIGDLTNIREDNNLGSVNNQKLHKFPFLKIVNQIKYKAKFEGIDVTMQEESYTSGCSPYDEIDKANYNKAQRKHRGLFVIERQIFNADCVGAYNILRKYLCRMNKPYPAVVGLDSPAVYRFNYKNGFNENPKLPNLLGM